MLQKKKGEIGIVFVYVKPFQPSLMSAYVNKSPHKYWALGFASGLTHKH